MFTISSSNMDELQSWLSGLPDELRAAVLDKSQTLADALQQKVAQKLSGEVLQSRTGQLRDSIMGDVQETDAGVNASMFVNSDVPYAAIQEYGGTTKAHVIAAVSGKMLVFNAGGKLMFAQQVNHRGSVIPEHSYLRSSLDDMSDDITDEMSAISFE